MLDIKSKLPKTRLQFFFVSCLMIITMTNFVVLQIENRRIANFRKVMKHQIIGHQFRGLEEFIKGQKYISYYTDLDITEDKHQKIFSQAQYMLAPTILDYGNLHHEYIFFVCSDERIAWQMIKQLNVEPLRKNKWGMILAKKKK